VPMRLDRREKIFVMWGGLKGAVPILLAAFALRAGVGHAQAIYEIVFVVVLASVVVQGGTIPSVAGRLGIEMRRIPVIPRVDRPAEEQLASRP